MRRFIVEVVLDAFILLVIALLLGIFSVSQPFPFGPNRHRSSPSVAPVSSASCRGQPSWCSSTGSRDRYSSPSPAGCCSRRWASSS